jgi:hypothetical protein
VRPLAADTYEPIAHSPILNGVHAREVQGEATKKLAAPVHNDRRIRSHTIANAELGPG